VGHTRKIQDGLERLPGGKIKKKKTEGEVGRPEKIAQQARRERKTLSIFKTFYNL
jgi:hypothetical protein